MKERGLDMTVGSYGEVFEDIMKTYNISKHTNRMTRLDIIHGILEVASEKRRVNKVDGKITKTLPNLRELPKEIKKLLIYG